MKTIILVLCAVFAISAQAGQKGNGGAGVRNHGVYQSFYSAGFYVEPQAEETPPEVPQLNELIEFINSFPDMSPSSRATLLAAIVPTPARQYFKIDEASFDETTRERLLDEYARVMKTDRNGLEIFAVTDTATKRTYLLPAFYQLPPHDQMAILFHEAFWIINPTQTYAWIVEAEMAFQAVLEKPTDTLRIIRFMKYYSTEADRLKAAIGGDLRTRALPRTLRLVDLVGQDYLNCKLAGGDKDCISYALAPMHAALKKYPNSAVLKLFQASLLDDRLTFGRNADGLVYYMRYDLPKNAQWFQFSSCEITLEWVGSINPQNSSKAGLRMGCEQRYMGGQPFRFKNDLILYF